ncbi:helix-turn-helix domain-containing protein, partial [Streptococcus suis]
MNKCMTALLITFYSIISFLGKFREFLEVPFRKRVIAYVETGHSKKETCQLFGISTNTLYLWEKQLKELGHL